MKAINFPEANHLIPSYNPGTSSMPVFTDGQTCVSEWELTDEDIKEIILTRKVQLIVRSSPIKHPDVAVFAGNVLPTSLKP